MAGAPDTVPDTVVVVDRRPLWQRIVKWVAIGLAAILLLVVLLVLGINTSPGRRVIANYLSGYTLANGLNVKVGRIDGSIYGAMVLRDVRVQDAKGTFLTSPQLNVDWRPFAFTRSHVDVRSVTSQLITYQRNPVLKPSTEPTDPNAPTLPDLDIDVNRLAVDRLVIGKAVTGQAHVLKVASAVHIADRRAQVTGDIDALRSAGIAGGDSLVLKLNAVPDDNKLDIDARLRAPQGGVVAGMASLTQPLEATIAGRGSWKAWTGRANALVGGQSFADLTIQANDGRFQVRGPTRPSLFMDARALSPAAPNTPAKVAARPGGNRAQAPTPANPVAALTAPQLDVALDVTLAQRRADTKFSLRSDALGVEGQGLIDLAQSRLGNFRVAARLLTPGAILPNLNGRNVAADVILDGPFATPTVNYTVRADSLGFNETRVEGLFATGIAKVDADHILVPVQARARRVLGLNQAVGGLLENVAIGGDIAINGDQILSDNLRVRSRNVDATAIVVADLSTGRYTGAVNGRINNYRVESIGIVSVETNMKLVTAPQGGFGITGRVVARTQQIFNEGARNFLGGNAYVRTDVGYSPEGIVTFRNLRMTSPQFRVTSGSGRYDPRGGILVNADAFSTQYGPLSARVSGTVTSPVVLLRAARPGVGIGLVNLEARVRGANGAYAVTASGGTTYGPFNADVLVRPSPRLTVDIRRAVFAGVNFNGRVQQTPAGPFAGRVAFNGSGINGSATLANQGGVQRADVAARANNATIPGTVDFTIGRAIVDASVVLYAKGPQVIADAQLADMRYGAMVLQSARAKVNYQNGAGTAQAVATGSNGVPFNIAVNSRLSPSLWLVAAQGRANGIGFRTAGPARIKPLTPGYQLLPTRIDFDQGSVRLAGTYNKGLTAQARIDRLDLSVANALVPGLGLGGNATGSMDFRQAGNAFPTALANVQVTGFTRSSLAAVSEPVDIVFQGRLQPGGGDARALIKRGGSTVGRMVASLQPVSGSGSWVSRLMAAPLKGGLRYSGPAGVLFSLAALPDQQLTGPIAIGVDFSGRLQQPTFNGVIRADNLTYENETYGTRLTNMRIGGRFDASRFELTQLQARAGDGTVQASGTVGLASAEGFPMNIQARLDNARLARSDALGATATGTLAVTKDRNGGLIRGDLTIPEARYQIIRQGQAEVAELTGIRRKSQLVKRPTDRPAAQPAGLFKLDIRVRADNQLFVSGMGLESEWRADMRIGGTSAAPQVNGGIDVVRGTYSFAGKRFELDSGTIRFQGGALTDPSINISASTETDGITVTINITGTGQNPRVAFTSSPSLPQDEVLSRLLFGSSPENLSATEALQLASALNSLRGSGGGLNPLGKLRSATGFDRLRVLGGDEATGRGTALAAGKYLTDDIYIEIITDARGFTATQLQVALTKALSLLSSTGSFGGSNVGLRYQRNF